MTSVQFDALFAIAKYGSMNKAAEALFISQPALKKRLDSLERELGFPLVYRTKAGCSLTEAGQVICRELEPLQAKIHEVLQEAGRAAFARKLRISQVPLLTLRYCDRLLADFHRMHEEILLERVFMDSNRWIRSMKNGELDICLAPGSEASLDDWKKKGFCCIYDGVGHLVCILSGKHPLGGHQTMELAELKNVSVFSEKLMMACGGLHKAAEKSGIHVVSDRSAYSRYEMIERCSQGVVYLMDAALSRMYWNISL